jgi:hypothetical protein
VEDLVQKTEDYNKADIDYRESILKYGVTIISAQIAVLGFLIQNDTTRYLLRGTRFLFMSAITFTFLSILMLIAFKKLLVLYSEKIMHNAQYSYFHKHPELRPLLINTTSEKRKKDLLRGFWYARRLPDALRVSQVLMGLGLIFYIIAIGVVLYRI